MHLPDAFASASPRCLQHAGVLNAVAALQSLLHTVDACSLVHIHRDDASAVFVRHTDVGATPWKGGYPGSLGQDGGAHLKMQNNIQWHDALKDNVLLSSMSMQSHMMLWQSMLVSLILQLLLAMT